MATRQGSLLGGKRADGARSAAKWLLSVAICLLLVQGGRTQTQSPSLTVLIERNGAPITPITQNTEITLFVSEGDSVKLNCYCSGYHASMEMIHNGSQIESSSSCLRLLHNIANVTFTDQGWYTCRAQDADGNVIESHPLGNLTILDSSVVQAEPMQYGLLNDPVTLNCSTTLERFTFLVEFTWFRGEGTEGPPLIMSNGLHFERTALSDEGMYTCKVNIQEIGLVIKKTINFQVVVPPRIFHDDGEIHFTGNTEKVITVPFQSRFMVDTNVTWWKNGKPLLGADASHIQQTVTTPPNSTTELILNPPRRNDSGVYEVSVENRFDIIPRHLQVVRISLTVRIFVPPAKPVISVSEPYNTVSWSLPQNNEDQRADNYTVSLNFTNGTVAQERALNGDDSQTELSVVPGMGYVVAVIAHNVDGSTVSDVEEFITPPGAPFLSFVQVNRVSNSSIEIIVNLAYTGGGDITYIHVSFREIGTSEWIRIEDRHANSMSEMTWKAFVEDDRFVGIGIEFLVAVKNGNGHSSEPITLKEPLDPPGPPTLEGISMSYDSLTIQLTFSNEGTPPILSLVVEFTAPKPFTRNFSGPFIRGEVHSVRVTGLHDNTQYSFTLSAVNYEGRGELSSLYNSTTAKRPPLDLHEIILIAIAAAALVIIIIVILAVVFLVMSKRHKQKKTYFFNNQRHMDMTSEDKQLDSNHEMIRRGSNSYTQHNPTLPSSRSILSTSTTNSSYVPTSPPFSPPGAPSILRISDPSSVERYRYETCSSTTSNSGQSDESDAGIRYTYNISPSPPAVEVDTPDLRAQSTYSVMTTTTRMTSTSSSNSTRESLTYTHESNATVV